MSLPQNIDRGKTDSAHGTTTKLREHRLTQCATITGEGRSAIAVVAIRGTNAAKIVSRCFRAASRGCFSPHQIRYGVWGQGNESGTGESVVLTPLREDHFEIHCHGGPAATARIIEDVVACGAERIEAEQWKLASEDLLIHEAEHVLSRCITAKTAAIAMDQVRGALQDWAMRMVESLSRESGAVDLARRQAEQIRRSADFTTRLAEPFRVVLAGPPNVGKSSLLNAMVGFDRSITLDEAGTTRDVLHAETVIHGLPIRLSDTAGIRDSDQSIEQQGIARARLAADQADLVLSVREPSLVHAVTDTSAWLDASKPVIAVLNKCDLLTNGATANAGEVMTNALTGEGVEMLLEAITDLLGREIPKPASPVAVNDRQADLLHQIATGTDNAQVMVKLRELLGVRDRSEDGR